MIPRTPRSTRTYTLIPDTTLFRSAGYALEPRLTRLARALPKGEPLLWFGLFKDVQRLSAADVPSLLHAPAAKLEPPSPQIEQRRSEEHTSELQSLMRISYAVFCLKKKNHILNATTTHQTHHHKPKSLHSQQ